MKSAAVLLISFASAVAFANADPTTGIKYSADKIIQNQSTHTVDLIGHAEVILGSEKITGHRIKLNLKTRSAETVGIARITSANMRVESVRSAVRK